MNKQLTSEQVAYCGLLCGLCQPGNACGCRANNHCGKRRSPNGCYQYDCCTSKGINGCWECADAPCGKDMLSAGRVKPRAFVTCIKEDGMADFLKFIERNANNGVVYHREGIRGDYDLDSEEAVLRLLRTGKSDK